jgi:hypothetical protein
MDFPGGHPPEYYPRLTLLNFTDRTGCGAVNVIWPITTTIGQVQYTNTKLPHHHSPSLSLIIPVTSND